MIVSSKTVKIAAVICACLTHAALAWALIAEEQAEVEGGQGAAEAKLGSSFADMAAGTLSASNAEEMIEPPTPEETAQEQPEDTKQARPTDSPAVETPETVEIAPPEDTRPVEPDNTPAQEQILAALIPETPDGMTPLQPTETPQTQPESPAEKAEPLRPVPAQAPEPAKVAESPEMTEPETTQTVEDSAEDMAAVSRSLRPMQRSAEFEKRHKPKPKSKPKPVAKQAPRGNSDRDATAGSATGTRQATAKRQGSNAGRAAQSGNAAVSNYPGLVMQKISRVRKPTMNRTGVTRVSFTIAGSGGLAGVSVARSSGSAQLDRAALRLIQRGAPFPSPPVGARRSFAIEIEFRR